MSKTWYDDLSEEDARFYEESVNRIKKGVEQDMTFEQAVGLIDIGDEKLKGAIVDDALKVIIAELHFMGKQSIEQLAKKLRLPEQVLSTAREEMIKAVESDAIEAFKASQGQQGTA